MFTHPCLPPIPCSFLLISSSRTGWFWSQSSFRSGSWLFYTAGIFYFRWIRPAAKMFYKWVASLISEKHNQPLFCFAWAIIIISNNSNTIYLQLYIRSITTESHKRWLVGHIEPDLPWHSASLGWGWGNCRWLMLPHLQVNVARWLCFWRGLRIHQQLHCLIPQILPQRNWYMTIL